MKEYKTYAVEPHTELGYNIVYKRWTDGNKDRIYMSREGASRNNSGFGFIAARTGNFYPAKGCDSMASEAAHFMLTHKIIFQKVNKPSPAANPGRKDHHE